MSINIKKPKTSFLKNIVFEIGLNHLGSQSYFQEYVDAILKYKIKFVTIQLREKSFYIKSKNKLLPSIFLEEKLKFLQSQGVNVGLAICDYHFIDYIKNFNPDFFKILSWVAEDLKFIKNINNYKKNIYISLGMINNKSIYALDKKLFKMNGKFNYIYTILNYDENKLNLKLLPILKKKLKFGISYGHHALDDIPFIIALAFEVDKIFIYVKSKKSKKHNDEDHAIYLKDFPSFLKKIDKTNNYIGVAKKEESINYMEKIYYEK